MIDNDFKKSEQGADSAWKGFTSQSLYILFRIINADDNFDYYPEKLEDLMIMRDKDIVEIVQVKDYSSDLTISDLDASTKSEGLFRRALSLKKNEQQLLTIRVVYFGTLGYELSELEKGNIEITKLVTKKLCDKYGFLKEDAKWLLSRLQFQKVTQNQLESAISEKVEGYAPTMIAPHLAKDLLAYYIFKLSKSKGKTSRNDWQEKIFQIGNDMASFDGYSREYGGSLIRLSDIIVQEDKAKLDKEFRQGVSTRPEHIYNRLDLERKTWLEKIKMYFCDSNSVVIKGASGQGKTALCYRYLYNEYAPECVFLIRAIKDQTQAENLVKAIVGLSKHYFNNIIMYIDVNPGEAYWTWVLREAQARSLKLKILVSIREEDFKLSNVDTSLVSPKIIDVCMEKDEANRLYDILTSSDAHPIFRTFADAWNAFGEFGPLLEFIFLLKNNETLKQRLETQIRKIIYDAGTESEEWLSLLRLVCYASQYGCPSLIADIRNNKVCSNLFAALDRMNAEYLIRNSADGRYLEALHPIRANILYNILKDIVVYPESELLVSCVSCSEKYYVRILLLNYFIEHDPDDSIVAQLAKIPYKDWEGYSGAIDAMIWLDVRSFINKNISTFDWLVKEKGRGWSCFIPLDVSGLIRPNETIFERMDDNINSKILEEASRIKSMFTSLSIDYHFCDLWLHASTIPYDMPTYDIEWMHLGYSLFWMSKRGKLINLFFEIEKIKECMKVGTIEYKAAALQGFYSQRYDIVYNECAEILINRIISDYKVIYFNEDESCVRCGFVPPILSENNNQEVQQNFNHYWTMKMVDIFSRIYPTKSFIEVNLIGIDLLGDLGIESLDSSKNIPLENRPDKWITRINTWCMNLIEFKYRPNNWIEFIDNIINVRKVVADAFAGLIKEIDTLYKKGYIKDTNTIKDIFALGNKLLHSELFLPAICVDKFGMYGESNNLDNMLKASINLSIYETSEFRKAISNIISSVQTFATQFSDVLVARRNELEMTYDSKVRLSEFNIYSATKSYLIMQREFDKLFSPYVGSDYQIFVISEKDIYLTLLGVWNEVIRTPIRMIRPLSYDIKTKNRKLNEILIKNLKSFVNSEIPNIRFVEIENHLNKTQYFLYDCNLLDEVPIQELFQKFCLTLRNVFKSAETYNCYRCYLETYWPKMIIVFMCGNNIISAFLIPIYKLFDIPETEISNTLLPELLSDETYTKLLHITEKSIISRKCVEEVGKIRLLLLHYNAVVNTITENQVTIKVAGIEHWFIEFCERLNIDENVLSKFITYCGSLAGTNDGNIISAINTLTECFEHMSNISERLNNFEPINDIIESLQTAMVCILFLSNYL